MSDLPLWELLGPDSLFRNAVVGGLLVGLLCAALGVYVALRRIVLVGVALPQVAAAGVALAFWWTGHGHAGGEESHFLAGAAALVASAVALALLVIPGGPRATPPEWRVGALLATSMALTLLLVALHPRGDLELTSLLRGDLLAIPDADLHILLAASIGSALLFALFRRELLLVSFDPEYARTLGFSPVRHDLLFYVLLGLTVSLGVMTAGPLVVFGFLVLPPLAALQVAGGIGAAFGVALAVAAFSSLGGFALAYRADLPAGPTGVTVAALVWLAIALSVRLWRMIQRHRMVSLALLLLPAALSGCASAPAETHPPAGIAQAALAGSAQPAFEAGGQPALAGGAVVSVLRVHNATGDPLRIPSANPLPELARAAGDPFQPRGETVPDRLQRMATAALAERGFAVRPPDAVRGLLAEAPATPAEAAQAARRAGLDGLVLQSSLRRFSFTGSDLLRVQLDAALVDPADGRVLWTGQARGPYSVRGALTVEDLLADVHERLTGELFEGP